MSLPAAGWYPDPEGGAAPRWWDGQTWAAPTPAPVPAPVPSPAAAAPDGTQAYPPQTYPPQPQAWGQPSAAPGWGQPPAASWPSGPYRTNQHTGNGMAFAAMGVSALYIVIALTAGIVFVGIVPILFVVRSFRAGEKLAPLALVVALVALVVGIASFAHR